VSHCEAKATALHSTLEATSGKETRTIETNKSYSVLPEIRVDYNDSWNLTMTDDPEYSRDAESQATVITTIEELESPDAP